MGGGDVASTQDAAAEQGLKHLEFFYVAALHATACFLNLYGYAKEKSGPLKSGIESVEGAVKTVVRPVFDKYHDAPIEVLKFVDRKVDRSMAEINRCIPPVIKQVSSDALSAAHKAPEAAQAVAAEVKSAGVVGTASGIAKSVYTKYEPAAREIYSKYEPKAEQYAASTWRKLNQLPVFPQVANMALPAAAYCSEKYNEAVICSAEKGYRVSSYLPLIPMERIARVFREERPEMEPLVGGS